MVAITANTGNRWALIISRASDMDGRFELVHSQPFDAAAMLVCSKIDGDSSSYQDELCSR